MANCGTCISSCCTTTSFSYPYPWREVHGYHPVPSSHIEHYCFWYSLTSILVCVWYMGVIRLVQRDRGRTSADSLLVLHSWPRWVRKIIPLFVVLGLFVPVLLVIIGHIGALILALAEDWPYLDTFEYLLCNMVALPPMNTLTPTGKVGQIIDVIVSASETVISACVVGLCAAMTWCTYIENLFSHTYSGLFCAIAAITLSLIVIGFISSLVLTLLESSSGVGVWESFMFTMSVMCGIGNPLTNYAPVSDAANFFAALCSMVQLAIGGAIIGILGGHPKMQALVIALEGEEEEEGVEAKQVEETPVDGKNYVDATIVAPNLEGSAVPQERKTLDALSEHPEQSSSYTLKVEQDCQRTVDKEADQLREEIQRLNKLSQEALEKCRAENDALEERLRAKDLQDNRLAQAEESNLQLREEIQRLRERLKIQDEVSCGLAQAEESNSQLRQEVQQLSAERDRLKKENKNLEVSCQEKLLTCEREWLARLAKTEESLHEKEQRLLLQRKPESISTPPFEKLPGPPEGAMFIKSLKRDRACCG